MRITPTRRASEKHYRRLKEYAPKTGIVRVFKLTERQYDSIYMLTGEIDYQENTVGRNCHIMLQWRHEENILCLNKSIFSIYTFSQVQDVIQIWRSQM